MHRALADIPRGKEVLAIMVLAAEFPWEKECCRLLCHVLSSSSFLSLKY